MLCSSGFVDYVMFPHSGASGPESKTTRVFRPVLQVAALEAKSAVSFECILFSLVSLVAFIPRLGRSLFTEPL